MELKSGPRQDEGLGLPLLALFAVLSLFWITEHPESWDQQAKTVSRWMETEPSAATSLGLSVLVNVVFCIAWFGLIFQIGSSGKMLSALAKKRGVEQEGRVAGFTGYRATLFGLVCGGVSLLSLHLLKLPKREVFRPLSREFLNMSNWVLFAQIQFGMTLGIAAGCLSRLYWNVTGGLRMRHLPRWPKGMNQVTLGSLNDETRNQPSSWLNLGTKALNGNILITGSIGSGKTQGTILNYCDQLLSRFEPRPSLLAIDPKGTFIPEVLKMVRKYRLEKEVLHLKLGGTVTFNPIYCEAPLKDARFLDLAQMIRAAAANFSGKTGDSPFWELAGYNLLKNTLVFCAIKAKGRAFHLGHLYSGMIEVSQDPEQAREVLSVCSEAAFDLEEQFNAACAARYFLELDQMEEKLRSGILATATAFLNQFQEFQANQIFCPEHGSETISNMDPLIDQGKLILFDISTPGLARSMGTFVKLHYEQSVLNRLIDPKRDRSRLAVILADEYQDVVSTGGGQSLGDDRFCAKSREANASAIFATQSLTSLKNSIGKEDSAKELFQNFRTFIACHSTDLFTIHSFQELMGQEERTRVSRSFSESTRTPAASVIGGGIGGKNAGVSEGLSVSLQKEHRVTARDFATLSSFESYARIYDGFETKFQKLFLKPYFLKKRNLVHRKLQALLKTTISLALLSLVCGDRASAFPNACTVIQGAHFRSCLDFKVGACMCGWPVPRPCAQFSYYIPQTFLEVFPNPSESFFKALPGAAVQLNTLAKTPYGEVMDSDTQSFHAHALQVPLSSASLSLLPCGPIPAETTCFQAMSEHFSSNWRGGSADSWQPSFLAWQLSPKACLLKGAATSVLGEMGQLGSPGAPSCSVPMSFVPKYPPSSHSACNGWGTFFPRSGVYTGQSSTGGALMIASRLKSLGNEILHTVPADIDELWQMTLPQESACFREGQNLGLLEGIRGVREERRLTKTTSDDRRGFLFTVWSKVSCCRDLALVPEALAAIAMLQATCQGMGAP